MLNAAARQEFLVRNALDWHLRKPPINFDWRLDWLADRMALAEGDRALEVDNGQWRLRPYLKRRVGDGGLVMALEADGRALSTVSDQAEALTIHAATGLPIRNHSLEVIVCLNINLIADKGQVAADFFRALVPGGRVYIAHFQWGLIGEDFFEPWRKNIQPPCFLGLNSIFMAAGFGRIDGEEGDGRFLFIAQKIEKYFFGPAGQA